MAKKATANFGFRRVTPAEHTKLVDEVFDSVAARYDLMNDLMSGGIHRLWKSALIDRLDPQPGQLLLDVAGGTGDIARRFLRRAGAGGRAIICDLNESMLRTGRDRDMDLGETGAIARLCGNAEALPVAAGSMDAYTIAFGLRNVTRIPAATGRASALPQSLAIAPVSPRSMSRSRPVRSMLSLRSQIMARPPAPARRRKRRAMSPVPPATSSSNWPGCGSRRSIRADFHRRWMPPDIRSFIRS